MLNIVYQSPWPIGGFGYYTSHLWRVMAGQARIVRLGAKDEQKPRTHCLGFPYYITTLETLLRNGEPLLLAAHDPKMEQTTADALLDAGAWRVFHDPDDLHKFPVWKGVGAPLTGERVICIRQNGLLSFTGARAKFIPHPYIRRCDGEDLLAYEHRPQHAVSTAMTCKRKNSQIILDANDLTHKERQVLLCGNLERWFKMDHEERLKGHPCKFPNTFDGGIQVLRKAKIQVDLSVFPADGGGTQYSFLEAMDCGNRIIAHNQWLDYPGPMKDLATGISTAKDLAEILMWDSTYDAQRNWDYLISTHNPDSIRRQYLETMGII